GAGLEAAGEAIAASGAGDALRLGIEQEPGLLLLARDGDPLFADAQRTPARVALCLAHVVLDHERRLRARAVGAPATLDACVDRNAQLGAGPAATLDVGALERGKVVAPRHRPLQARAAVTE